MDDSKQERSRKVLITALAAALATATPNLFMAVERMRSASLIAIWSVATALFAAALLNAIWARKK